MVNEPDRWGLIFEVQRAERQSRVTNFPLLGSLIRFVLIIPHLFALFFLGLTAATLYFIATFIILFKGKYPEGIFRFIESYVRWGANVNTYLLHLHDKYPPFSEASVQGYPVTLEAMYPEHSSGLLNFPFWIGYFIRAILLIPHFIILFVLQIIQAFIILIAQFIIVFIGRFPTGMHSFAVGVARWGFRLEAYMYGLSDKYPPFSRSASASINTPPPDPTPPGGSPELSPGSTALN